MLASLYFSGAEVEPTRHGERTRILDSGLAGAIPLHTRFAARGHPVVGTSLEYFELRKLRVARGRPMAVLGECVIGASVARELGLGPGDTIVTSPQTAFDLAGVYPLEMSVAGVLAPAGTPDDTAIFPDINTVAVVVRRLQSVAIIQNGNVVQYVPSGGTGPYGLASDQVNKQLIVTNRDTGNAWVIYKDGGAWRLDDRSEMKDFGNMERTQPFEVASTRAMALRSRFILAREALETTRQAPTFSAFQGLFEERGLPEAIRTDNGLYNLSKLSEWWLRLGIERIKPGHQIGRAHV